MGRLQWVLVALAALGTAHLSEARTWRVEKDGAGDFSVIYEAVDVCAAGDTILIGPGRFEEYRREPDYLWPAYCCMHVTTPDLTIIGSGAQTTMVGLDRFDPDYQHYVIGISCNHNDLTIENLTVQGIHEGIHFEGPNLSLTDCIVSDCNLGVATWGSATNTFRRCQFVNYHHDGIFGAHPNNTSIIECEFYGGSGAYAISGVGGINWSIRDCAVHDCTAGIQLEQGATGTVEGCRVQVTGNGAAPAISLKSGAVVSLYNNVFGGAGQTADFLTNGTVVTANNNIFEGGTYTVIWIGLTPMDFHGNHIINGGGKSVRAEWPRGDLDQPYDLDLTGNYWGTTDPVQIASWIDDYGDHDPMALGWYVSVRYTPFADQPMQTQQKTWGAVKSLFRDATR